MSGSGPPTDGWWGDGPPPWEQWSGVSLVIEAEWSEERERWESHGGRYWFDPDAADEPSLTAEYFVPPRGELAGQSMKYLPWQLQLVILPLFGWMRSSDNTRRFRRVFVFVPKKNGKSVFCSALGPHLAFCDGERGAQVYVAAGDEEQARIVWADTAEMINGSEEFANEEGLEVLANSIVQPASNSHFRPLTSKAATKHGFDVHALIFDELHAQKSRKLYETLKRGVSARRQPVVMVITTAGDDRQSICYEEYEGAKRVLQGVSEDEQLLPVIFEPREEDDWTDPEMWHRVNPGLGTVKSADYMQSECLQARNEPRKRNDFLRLECNVWTESRTVWIPPESWSACKGDLPEQSALDTYQSTLGIDLAETLDLCAMARVWRIPDDRPADEIEVQSEERGAEQERQVYTVDFKLAVRAWFWLPHDVYLDRVRRHEAGADWSGWKRDGWLLTTPGGMTDYRGIVNTIRSDVLPFGQVAECAFDPYNCRQVTPTIQDDLGIQCVEVRQGPPSLSAACKLLEGLVATRRVVHDGNPLLRWCFANAEVRTDVNGNIAPNKPDGDHRSTRRIDGVSATVTALARLMLLGGPTQSVYETRGLLVL